jgi:hypothetical protein
MAVRTRAMCPHIRVNRTGQLTPAGTLPPVVPVVLYNGLGRWTASQNAETLVEPHAGRVEFYRCGCRICSSTRRYTEGAISAAARRGGVVPPENSRTPTDVQRVVVVGWSGLAHASPRRAFTVWLRRVLPFARLLTVSIPEMQDLGRQTMLAERVIEWTQQ